MKWAGPCSLVLLTVLGGCAVDPARQSQPTPQAPPDAASPQIPGERPGAEARQHSQAQAEARQREIVALREEIAAAAERLGEVEAAQGSLQPRQTARGLVITLDELPFGFDSAELAADARPAMARLARYLQAHPDDAVLIEGHTDSVGRAAYNQRLSERRAQAVVAALKEHGIEPGRLEAVGMGEARPVATNDTEEGRAQNRRVEVIVGAGEARPTAGG